MSFVNVGFATGSSGGRRGCDDGERRGKLWRSPRPASSSHRLLFARRNKNLLNLNIPKPLQSRDFRDYWYRRYDVVSTHRLRPPSRCLPAATPGRPKPMQGKLGRYSRAGPGDSRRSRISRDGFRRRANQVRLQGGEAVVDFVDRILREHRSD